MAVVEATKTNVPGYADNTCHVIAWTLAGADTATPIEMPASSDRSVQMAGTFAGASIAMQGSNDGTNFVTLTDPQGNPLLFSSAGLEQISEITRYVKPVTTVGTPTSVVVSMLSRRIIQ
jgi:hypothetical protein